jgi:pyruvate kinase
MFKSLARRFVQNTHITSKTKVVCTIGPASESPEILERMVERGMDVVRFNFSHDSRESHANRFNVVREISKKLHKEIAILADIQGPKIRVGQMEQPVIVHPGQEIYVTSTPVIGNAQRIHISYPNIHKDLVNGDKIYINDGIIDLEVIEKKNDELLCRVISGGTISTKKGCNLPSGNLSIDILSDKDKKDLELIAKLDPEFIALSFVGCGEDIRKVRQFMKSVGNPNIKLIAKIERPSCVPNIDDIIRESDGVMIARGDLGVELPVEQVPTVQKMIVRKANQQGKFAIVATQMLESMIENSRPTRAEANDVYNAVLDGADAVMLSGETSVGTDPVNVVKVMDTIVNEAEKHFGLHDPRLFDSGKSSPIEALGHSMYSLAAEFTQFGWKGKFIVLSTSGYTARMVVKYRPPMPVVVLSKSEKTVREMCLLWGVKSLLLSPSDVARNSDCGHFVHLAEEAGLIDHDDTHAVMISTMASGFGTNMSILDLKKVREAK